MFKFRNVYCFTSKSYGPSASLHVCGYAMVKMAVTFYLGNVHLLSEGGNGSKMGVYEKLMRSERGSMKII